jgi:predicted nucleic acid-binding protein
MTAKRRFSIDTNILVYAIDRDAGERHERAKEIVGRAAEHDCVLTVQALAEFFHVTTRKKRLDPAQASDYVEAWLRVFRSAAAGETALVAAMEAVEEHRLSFWDAMLWATVRDVGGSAILSEDMQDGRRVGGVEFVNPFAGHAEARLAELL